MRYIITIEFWKKLAQKIISEPEWKKGDVTFHRRNSIWYLTDLKQESMTRHLSDQTRSNRDRFKLTLVVKNSITELNEMATTETWDIEPPMLAVNVDIKAYVFYHVLIIRNVEEQSSLGQGWKKIPIFYEEENWIMTSLIRTDLAKQIDTIEMLKATGKNNLSLMRHRFAPRLDLNEIYSTRCLIIGTGTLGCNVARGLLSWGIENITFIDNAFVSYSNLLRQSLFEFSDIGKPKALAAANRVSLIYPPAQSLVSGHQYEIPMPDHPDTTKNLSTKVEMLDRLIENCDLVFLCTDNKESRWLPTIAALAKEKPLINLAIGFDSWVVMRHPLSVTRSPTEEECNNPELWNRLSVDQIGCYFCTSVEGIVNTMQDRQMDERCTVSRGGASTISSAVAVELAISLMTHPEGFRAQAGMDDQNYTQGQLSVKYPPAQIRGTLGYFKTTQCMVRRNPQCCACSREILNYYTDSSTRLKFLENVCNDSQILKKITRLDQFEISTSRDNLLEIEG